MGVEMMWLNVKVCVLGWMGVCVCGGRCVDIVVFGMCVCVFVSGVFVWFIFFVVLS